MCGRMIWTWGKMLGRGVMRRSIEEGGGLVEEVVEVVDEDSSTTSATSTTSILLSLPDKFTPSLSHPTIH